MVRWCELITSKACCGSCVILVCESEPAFIGKEKHIETYSLTFFEKDIRCNMACNHVLELSLGGIINVGCLW